MTLAQLAALQTLACASVKASRSAKLPDTFADVSLAQAILESAWLEKLSGDNNVFGIIADHFNLRGATSVSTHEQTAKGLMPRMRLFQNYSSVEECFEDHARIFTTGPLALKCRSWVSGAVSGTATPDALVAAISFPSPPPNYATDPGYRHSISMLLMMPSVKAALAAAKGKADYCSKR